jgi:hypothetical protein
MLKDLRQKYAGKSKSGISGPVPKEELRVAEQSSWEAANGGFPISALAQPPKSVPNGCDTTPSLYIRKNPLDTFLYGIPDVAKAQGASVSFTDDFANRARSATIDGFAGVALFRDPCVPRSGPLDSSYLSGYVFAPFIDAHGTLSSKTPRTVKTEHSVLTGGLDSQIEITDGPLFKLQYLTVTPYGQTDFRGIAKGEGVTAKWEPYNLDFRLGGDRAIFSDLFDWYWRLNAVADVKRLETVGLTNLTTGNYAWLGGTVILYIDLFPGEAMPVEIRNRLHLTSTFDGFHDANSGRNVRDYQTQLAYDLTADGSTSVSVEYDRGTSKETLISLKQFLVKLNYKY